MRHVTGLKLEYSWQSHSGQRWDFCIQFGVPFLYMRGDR